MKLKNIGGGGGLLGGCDPRIEAIAKLKIVWWLGGFEPRIEDITRVGPMVLLTLT